MRTDTSSEGGFDGFEGKVRPMLDRFEARRKQVLRKVCIAAAIILGLGLASLFLFSAYAPDSYYLIGILALVAIGIAFHSITKSFKADFKLQVVGAVVSSYHEGLIYNPEGMVSRGKFEASELFQQGIDRYRGEDYVSGRSGKTDFEFSELHAEYRTTSRDSKGRRRTKWHTIFKGVFFIADFHKEFRTHTVVLPDTAEKLLGFFGKKLQEWNFARAELVKLEDPEFEREFCVYGDDQVEARYILSPALMQRICGLKRKFGSNVYLAFLSSRVYIALSSSRNRFEPKVFSRVDDMALVSEYRQDLDMIIGIVEDLNLNTRIWSKE